MKNVHCELYRARSYYFVGIFASILMVSGAMVPMVYSWQLDVYLTQSTFGTSRAEVTVYGPFGWIENGYWEIGKPPIIASINVPESEIPEGYQYKVCVGAGFITLFANCQFFTHGSGDESVNMVIPS